MATEQETHLEPVPMPEASAREPQIVYVNQSGNDVLYPVILLADSSKCTDTFMCLSS